MALKAIARFRLVLACSVAAASLLLLADAAQARTITVNTAADTSVAKCTLRAAITDANTDLASNGCTTAGSGADTIRFQLPNPSTITLGSALDPITQDLNIRGPGSRRLTVSGNSLYRVFNIASGKTVSISGLEITDGSVVFAGCDDNDGVAAGSGILNHGTLTLDRVVVSGNTATATDSGGQACVFGAGIFNVGGATLTLNQSTVSGNRVSATESGAGSSVRASGGGIANVGTLRIDQSTVSGNTAHAYVTGGATAEAEGAGILNEGPDATVTNTTITNNGEITPGGQGGGIWSDDNLALRNDTVSQNVASAQTGDGGNLYNFGFTTSVTAKNTIVAEALTSGNCGGALPTSLGNNLSFESTGDTYPCFTPGNGNVFADPVLGPLQDNGGPTQTEAIGPGSAALDTGSGCKAADQRGIVRPQGTECDIGAFEFDIPPNTSITSKRVNQAKDKARFRFSSSEAASTFLCRLDRKAFKRCGSPKAYRKLKGGKHTFRVEARDSAGNIDRTPAVTRFRIKP